VHYLKIKRVPKFAKLSKSSEGEWNDVGGMVMNDDAEEDFVGLAFYSMEGEFKETEKPELKAISSQLMLDGVE